MCFGETVGHRDEPGRRHGVPVAALAHGVGQGHQIVVVRVGRQWPGVADQFPSAWGGDPAGVGDAQVPGVWFAHGGQRANHRR